MTYFPEGWKLVTFEHHHSAHPTTLKDCPYFGSPSIEGAATVQTDMGYSGGPMDDGNTFSQGRLCSVCEKRWTRLWVPRVRAVWLVDADRNLLAGTPPGGS